MNLISVALYLGIALSQNYLCTSQGLDSVPAERPVD